MEKNTDLRKVGPFRIIPDASVFYASRTHVTSLHKLQQHLAAGEPNTLVTGESGVGKSLLLLRAANELPANKTAVLLTYTDLNFSQLIAYVDSEVGRILSNSAARSGRSLKKHVASWREAGLRIVLLLDDADQLPDATLRSVYQLTKEDDAPIQCVFSGSPLFANKFYKLAGVREDLPLDNHVQLLNLQADEIADYLHYRLNACDGETVEHIDDDAIEILGEYSNGNAHKLHRLCQFLCFRAQTTGRSSIHAACVIEALAEMDTDLDTSDPCRWVSAFSQASNTITESWLPNPSPEEVFDESDRPTTHTRPALVVNSHIEADSRLSLNCQPTSTNCDNDSMEVVSFRDASSPHSQQKSSTPSGLIYLDWLTRTNEGDYSPKTDALALSPPAATLPTAKRLRHWSTIGMAALCVIVAALSLPGLVATTPNSANATITPETSLDALPDQARMPPVLNTQIDASQKRQDGFFDASLATISSSAHAIEMFTTSNGLSISGVSSDTASLSMAKLDNKFTTSTIEHDTDIDAGVNVTVNLPKEKTEQPTSNLPPSTMPTPIFSPIRSHELASLRVTDRPPLAPNDKLDIADKDQSTNWSHMDCGSNVERCDAQTRNAFMSATRR